MIYLKSEDICAGGDVDGLNFEHCIRMAIMTFVHEAPTHTQLAIQGQLGASNHLHHQPLQSVQSHGGGGWAVLSSDWLKLGPWLPLLNQKANGQRCGRHSHAGQTLLTVWVE